MMILFIYIMMKVFFSIMSMLFPDWYFYSLGIAISASFGVRGAQAFFKRK